VHTSGTETKLNFAAEICAYDRADYCTQIPGAAARYFGTALDQPRIILKSFIPWGQLGLTTPRIEAELRLQLGVTAFYRSKWMSIDGVMPEIGMAYTETWRAVKLGEKPPPEFQ
jgi:hypothetical protein